MNDPELGSSITSDMAYVMRGKGVPVKRSTGVDYHTRGVYLHIQGQQGSHIKRDFDSLRRRTNMRVFEDKNHVGKLLALSDQRKDAELAQAKSAASASIFGKM